MALCEDTDFIYPMQADVYYPIITQGEYGQPKKDWVFDKTIACNVEPVGGDGTENIKAESFLQLQNKLVARTKNDPRVSSQKENNAVTNILITNVRFPNGDLIYKETAGVRSGRATIYEVATVEPFVGAFRTTEYYKMLWRRAENQTVGD
ncbi:hypothetical protein EB001_12285 [bacterium]|jgi:hypothetical protein|nr:hypothetical protein [bacterium]